MKTNKKGISLIVLVITIIVIIILAAAVILTINNNNPMENANKAKYASDRATMQQALTTTVGSIMGKELTNPKFLVAAGGSEIGATDYQEIVKGTDKIFYKAGSTEGSIVFSSDTQTAPIYSVGYSLPRYGTGGNEGKWYISGAGDLRLVIDTKVFDSSHNGTTL